MYEVFSRTFLENMENVFGLNKRNLSIVLFFALYRPYSYLDLDGIDDILYDFYRLKK